MEEKEFRELAEDFQRRSGIIASYDEYMEMDLRLSETFERDIKYILESRKKLKELYMAQDKNISDMSNKPIRKYQDNLANLTWILQWRYITV